MAPSTKIWEGPDERTMKAGERKRVESRRGHQSDRLPHGASGRLRLEKRAPRRFEKGWHLEGGENERTCNEAEREKGENQAYFDEELKGARACICGMRGRRRWPVRKKRRRTRRQLDILLLGGSRKGLAVKTGRKRMSGKVWCG